MSHHEKRSSERRQRQGFTLIEVLVVVGIIALLVAILLPSLQSAREETRAVQCATNLKHLATAIAVYQTRDRVYPVSYGYITQYNSADPSRSRVDLSPKAQEAVGGAGESPDNGYVHWSYFLYNDGKVDEKAFQCPSVDNGGAPRTNPGPRASDWEAQMDDLSQTGPNPRVDLQAARMSYTTNAAVIPRNKFTPKLSGGPRLNRLVNESSIRRSSDVIMATEFFRDWQAITKDPGAGQLLLSKSHRPINPFYNVVTGGNEYTVPLSGSGFRYGEQGVADFGLLTLEQISNSPRGLMDNNGTAKVNVVGRHHPGGDKIFGGTAQFMYVDSHVERKTILETLKRKEWGDKYYTLTGPNDVQLGD